MTRTQVGEQRAREVAERAMAGLGFTSAALAREAGLDPGTVGDFIAGRRWPRREKLAAIERTLMLAPGTLSQLANGGEAEGRPTAVKRRGRPSANDAAGIAVEVAYQMHPRLRPFTDAELLREIQTRTLFYASRLTALGEPSLMWALSDTGGDEVVSGPPSA